MRIVIVGMKCSGKSTVAERLSGMLDIRCIETDDVIEQSYREATGEELSCREIWEQHGREEFRRYESKAVEEVAGLQWCVLSLGGSTFMVPRHRRMLCERSVLVWLNPPVETLWQRIQSEGPPPFLQGDDAREKFARRCALAAEIIEPMAHIACDTGEREVDEVAREVAEGVSRELHSRMMSPNTLGDVIRVTTFGESHGSAIGVVLDGLKAGIEIDEERIMHELARRRPGQSRITTSRSEADRPRIVSGVFEGKTTGAPVAMIIQNKDADPSKYEALKDLFRPGHADFTFWKKFGHRDWRGGGRSSGRETATRVAAGAIARTILEDRGVQIRAWTEEIAGIRAEEENLDVMEDNPVRCPDPAAAERMEEAILRAREENDSVGGIVRLRITGVPPGLGDPVFGKLDARLSGGLMSLGAVKGIEFGAGFGAGRLRGSENNDEMAPGGFRTNDAGGVLGGISTGQPIEARLAVKPTPSIGREQRTVDKEGNPRTMHIEGRHDPCIVPRLVPVVEAMAALLVLDMWEIQDRLHGIDHEPAEEA